MSNSLTHYAAFFKSWAVKTHGARPTADLLDQAHGLGLRPGKQALAVAMSLRPDGITAGQMQHACGAPQRNRLTGLIDDAYLKRVAMPKVDGVHTVYKCTVTPKGLKRIEATAKRAADLEAAGKVDGAPKVKKVAKGTAPRKRASKAKVTDAPHVPASPDEIMGDQQAMADQHG